MELEYSEEYERFREEVREFVTNSWPRAGRQGPGNTPSPRAEFADLRQGGACSGMVNSWYFGGIAEFGRRQSPTLGAGEGPDVETYPTGYGPTFRPR